MAPGGFLVRTALVAVAVVAALLVALWLGQRRLIYLPDGAAPGPAEQVTDRAEDVWLTTSDGLRLGAWYVPPTAADRGVTVLVANGNAGNRADRAQLARALAGAGFATLLFDYRGYGGNPGSPSEEGLALDVRAARSYLVDERAVPPGRLLYLGESLGTGVVAELATEHRPAGLMLRSPFVDLATLGQRHYPFLPVRLLLWDSFPVAESVARIDAPTTVVYGTADTIVPPDHSERVAECAGGPVVRVAVPGAGHNDAELVGGAEVVGALVDLARRAVGP
ncbi:alpha/beta hydrolase [Rhodococcus sp. UNC363MFTsu5.1]|uniref:alpha/beta hydrolase n=1 Tax=Rhodococcus sp. UNC363MFTsu5.1 TaxID=1449069 RepID=UPI00056D446C|nr:alpha/beta fold hydrolase [Rhodococcus sp. UNC363MFTsu5.1]